MGPLCGSTCKRKTGTACPPCRGGGKSRVAVLDANGKPVNHIPPLLLSGGGGRGRICADAKDLAAAHGANPLRRGPPVLGRHRLGVPNLLLRPAFETVSHHSVTSNIAAYFRASRLPVPPDLLVNRRIWIRYFPPACRPGSGSAHRGRKIQSCIRPKVPSAAHPRPSCHAPQSSQPEGRSSGL